MRSRWPEVVGIVAVVAVVVLSVVAVVALGVYVVETVKETSDCFRKNKAWCTACTPDRQVTKEAFEVNNIAHWLLFVATGPLAAWVAIRIQRKLWSLVPQDSIVTGPLIGTLVLVGGALVSVLSGILGSIPLAIGGTRPANAFEFCGIGVSMVSFVVGDALPFLDRILSLTGVKLPRRLLGKR